MHVLIVAKQPRPGFAKTRLIPAFGPAGAAALAAAALADTFDAVARCHADRVVVAFDGDPKGLVPTDFEVVPQRSGTFQTRLAGAWEDAGGGGLQIGMDTPQVTPELLDQSLATLATPGTDAVLGPAEDGGWWAIGLHAPAPTVFAGVPMSQADTGHAQWTRLETLGLAAQRLDTLRDVDEPDDVVAVAALAPDTRFAAVANGLLAGAAGQR